MHPYKADSHLFFKNLELKENYACRIHAHVFSFQFKPTIQPDFKKQLFKRVKKEGDSKRAKAHVDDYANQLSSRRVNLIRVLERRGSELAIPDGPLPEFEVHCDPTSKPLPMLLFRLKEDWGYVPFITDSNQSSWCIYEWLS